MPPSNPVAVKLVVVRKDPGLSEADIRTLLVESPARAFAVRRRALPGAA